MAFDLAICNGIIVSLRKGTPPFLGSIGIRHGLIEYVGERNIHPGDARHILDAQGKIVMPGLVNTHCHAEMAFARGLGDDLTLAEQIAHFGRLDWFFPYITDEDRFAARQLTYCEALLSGTTCLLDNQFWSLGEKSIQAMKSVGIKGGLVEDIFTDFARPDQVKPVLELVGFQKACHEAGLIPVLGAINEEIYTLPRLSEIHALSERLGCLLTSHLAETRWRAEWMQGQFHASAVQVLAQTSILTDRYIGSHGIFLSEQDICLYAAHGSKIVNTPTSEMKLGDGIAPIRELLAHGICVGLGTDGAMWNNSNDLFREMKAMALLHTISGGIRSISAQEILGMATYWGAQVLGLEAEIGTLEEGKKADVILIDACQPHMVPLRMKGKENVSAALVYCATGRDVTDVFVDGNHLVQDRRLMTIDIRETIAVVNHTSDRIEALL